MSIGNSNHGRGWPGFSHHRKRICTATTAVASPVTKAISQGAKVLQNLLIWPRLGIPALGSNIKWLHGDTEPGCPRSCPPCHYRAAAAAAAAASAPRVYSGLTFHSVGKEHGSLDAFSEIQLNPS